MAKPLPVDHTKSRRVVLCRFERAKSGDPDIARPQPDDRGYADATHGPIFGLVKDDTVTIRLRREMIDDDADIFVTSSDETIFEVTTPAKNTLLPKTTVMEVKIKGKKGKSPTTQTPEKAVLEVRYAATKDPNPDGPIIHQAGIWVWEPLVEIPVLPHNVTIEKKTDSSQKRASVANVSAIMDVVNAIWRPCGLKFIPANGKSNWAEATKAISIKATKSGEVDIGPWPAPELDDILKQGVRTKGVINAYFIHRFTGGTLGIGISPATASSAPFSHNGIVLADETEIGGGIAHTTPFSGNDLAHEIGHFLGLSHSENVHSNSSATDKEKVKDTWSRRCLMYAMNWADPATARRKVDYGSVSVFGGQSELRGAMITMKSLAKRDTDEECKRALSNLNAF